MNSLSQSDPILPMVDQFEALNARVNATLPPAFDDAAYQRHAVETDALNACVANLAQTPATTLQGAILKARMAFACLGGTGDDGQEAKLAESAFDDLDRLAG